MAKTPPPIIVGALAVIPKGHPDLEDIRDRMTLANPVYEAAVANGRPVGPTKTRKKALEPTLNLWTEAGGALWVPRALASEVVGSIRNETVLGEKVPMPSLVKLRPEQVPFVEGLVKTLETELGAVGLAPPGFGKTVCMLETASRLQRRTLILVHKEFLMTQWVERILGTKVAADRLEVDNTALSTTPMPPLLDLTPDQVGIVQQDICEYEGRSIVVAMAQSIASREYPKSFYESFGTIIVDEVHRFAAPTFQAAIAKFPGRYRLGVTATPDRKDGLQDVFYAHLGPIGAEGKVERLAPKIYQMDTPVILTREMERRTSFKGREDLTRIVSVLVEHESRNRDIVTELVKAVSAGRKVLVLSARREHLETLREEFITACRKEDLGVSTDFYRGGMDLKARKTAEGMQVLFGTFQMAEEGLDIPSLDTLFMTTPRGSVTQAVGRILRSYEGKKHPLVIDFVDAAFGVTRALGGKRYREYTSNGWRVS